MKVSDSGKKYNVMLAEKCFPFVPKTDSVKWARQNMGERVSSNSHSIHLPKTNSTLPISFSVSKIHWIWWEVRVFNGKTAPFKALSLFLFYSDIQSPDSQICSLFSPFFTFAFCLSHVHADREIRFQILSDLGCFSICYCLLSYLLISFA